MAWKTVDVECECDVTIDDILREFDQRVNESSEKYWRRLLPALDAMTRILACVTDDVIRAVPSETRKTMEFRLAKQASRYSGANLLDTKTEIMVLGVPAAKAIYVGLVAGAYLVVLVMVLAKLVTPLALAVGITLPMALRNVKAVLAAEPGKPESIAMGDVMSAQLHLAFCALFGIAILVGTFLK